MSFAIAYKYGADKFSDTDFDNTKISNEQYMFTLLPHGVKYTNSFLQSVPLAFCRDVGETHPLLRATPEKVEPQLPQKGEVYGIDGVQVEMKDNGIFKLCGHKGQGATCDCIQCLERLGEKVRVSTNPPLEEVSQQHILEHL